MFVNLFAVFLSLAQLFTLLSCQLEPPVVHVVFMNHLDVGYNGIPQTGFIANVVNMYFDVYFPRAIATAQAMRLNSSQSDRFVYTTHSWLVSMYMDCPSGLTFHCPNASAREAFTQVRIDVMNLWSLLLLLLLLLLLFMRC
jgi:hypothetical protein